MKAVSVVADIARLLPWNGVSARPLRSSLA